MLRASPISEYRRRCLPTARSRSTQTTLCATSYRRVLVEMRPACWSRLRTFGLQSSPTLSPIDMSSERSLVMQQKKGEQHCRRPQIADLDALFDQSATKFRVKAVRTISCPGDEKARQSSAGERKRGKSSRKRCFAHRENDRAAEDDVFGNGHFCLRLEYCGQYWTGELTTQKTSTSRSRHYLSHSRIRTTSRRLIMLGSLG
jgi:hypothetical protein